MRPLTAADILKVWEQGEGRPVIDRALTMLAVACPELSYDELAALSIGRRDARLFELRQLTFGQRLDGFTVCTQCEERLEFTLDTSAIRDRHLSPSSAPASLPASVPASVSSGDDEFEFAMNGGALRFRLPNSSDLAAVATCDDVGVARRLLAERCMLREGRNSDEAAELSDETLARLAERIGQCAPVADVMLDFACPSCGHEWQAMLDIAAFFWAEIAARARRLLREVHLLAGAYGWREAEILAMSARRRQAYLEMVG